MPDFRVKLKINRNHPRFYKPRELIRDANRNLILNSGFAKCELILQIEINLPKNRAVKLPRCASHH